MYKIILGYLKSSNEREWFRICLRLGKILMDQGGEANNSRLDDMIKEMKFACRRADVHISDTTVSAYDHGKANILLEVFALEIQTYTKRKETKKMRAVYSLS
jgi:hypothetical protein